MLAKQAVSWSFMYDYFNRGQGSLIGFAQASSLGEIHYFYIREPGSLIGVTQAKGGGL